MSALSIQPVFPIFTDIDGQPLEDGYVWIGTANLDPQTNPISVFFDAALSIPAAQPIRTISGYPANAGTPGRLYVNSDYSIRVMNKNGTLVYSAPTPTERYSSNLITFIQAGAGAVSRTVQSKLRDTVSVKDFGAVGDGVADDTAAIQAAIDTSGSVSIYFPPGVYRVTQTLNFTDGYRSLIGSGTITCSILSESTEYIIDATGSNWTRIQDITLKSATARVGLYYNRSTSQPLTFHNVLQNVNIEMGVLGTPDPSVNGGLGRVALYMRSLELSLFNNCAFVADTPTIITAIPNASFLPVYQTEGGANTQTVTEFQQCIFFSQTTNQYAVRLIQTGAMSFYSCYVGTFNVGGSPKPAFLADTIDGAYIQVSVEQYVQAMQVTSIIQASYLELYCQFSSTDGTVLLDNGDTALVSSAGNVIRVKTGGTPSVSNIAVKAPNQSTPNLFITATKILAVSGVKTPFASTNPPVSNEFNEFVSDTIYSISQIRFQSGNIIPNSGNGINFSNTPDAPGATSELLDDYEEGTFTPTLDADAGGMTTITYDAETGGRYTKVGNVVHFQLRLKTDAISGSTGSGVAIIRGLPYAAIVNSGSTENGSSAISVSGVSGWVTNNPSSGQVAAGQAFIYLQYRSTANGATTLVTTADIATGANANAVYVAGTYLAG